MRHGRVDQNQNEIIKTFRDLGCSVAITSDLGHGIPDLVVALGLGAGQMFFVEVKDGKKFLSQRKLTLDERIFHDAWKGPIYIIETVDQAIDLVNKARCRG